MTKFEKIKEIIANFQKNADRHYSTYQERERLARAKYSPEGFREEHMMKTFPETMGQARASADIAIKEINDVFNDIDADLKKWIMKNLDASTVQILDCIKNFDLQLSLDELKVIEESVRSSYLGTRIFEGISEKNGYCVNNPRMEEYQSALKSARNNASLAVRAYAGSPDNKFPGKDLLQKWEKDGVVLGNYEIFHMLYAYQYLQKGELDRLEQMFDSTRAPMHYTLSDKEAEKVKKSIEGIVQGGKLNRKAAQQLLKKDPGIKSKLESMPSDYLLGKEEVAKYFGLSEKTENEKKESRIDPATKNAPAYGTKFSKIDPQTLGNFS